MKLQEIFNQLSDGEFSQLSIGGGEAGVIDEANYSKVVGHVNLALIALFKRFTLKEGCLILQLRDDRTSYKLNSAFAVTGAGTEPVRYILDSVAEPFTDDIIKIEKVTTDLKVELGLNNSADKWSVFTPSALVLRIRDDLPEDVATETVTVTYRAAHPKVAVSTVFVPSRVEIELPDTHLECLLYYVASRVHNPIGMSNEFHAGNSYYAKYEAACQALEGQGLQVDQDSQNTRLRSKGWV